MGHNHPLRGREPRMTNRRRGPTNKAVRDEAGERRLMMARSFDGTLGSDPVHQDRRAMG